MPLVPSSPNSDDLSVKVPSLFIKTFISIHSPTISKSSWPSELISVKTASVTIPIFCKAAALSTAALINFPFSFRSK